MQRTCSNVEAVISCNVSSSSSFKLWHARLGHPSKQRMRFFVALNSQIHIGDNTTCNVCHMTKHKRLPFPISQSSSEFCFDLVHIDIWEGTFPCDQFISSGHVAASMSHVLPNVSSSSMTNKHTKYVIENTVPDKHTVHDIVPSDDVSFKSTRPVRNRQLPQHLHDYQVNIPKARKSFHIVAQVISYQNFSSEHLSYIANTEVLSEPKNYKQAILIHRVLRYLKGTPRQGLFFPADNQLKVSAFSDSDWASCPDSRRSITRFCVF
ncbi:hypothetical protein GQ457_16G010620 [Hibiscus cannabinus]